jgi:hypothetical protein
MYAAILKMSAAGIDGVAANIFADRKRILYLWLRVPPVWNENFVGGQARYFHPSK